MICFKVDFLHSACCPRDFTRLNLNLMHQSCDLELQEDCYMSLAHSILEGFIWGPFCLIGILSTGHFPFPFLKHSLDACHTSYISLPTDWKKTLYQNPSNPPLLSSTPGCMLQCSVHSFTWEILYMPYFSSHLDLHSSLWFMCITHMRDAPALSVCGFCFFLQETHSPACMHLGVFPPVSSIFFLTAAAGPGFFSSWNALVKSTSYLFVSSIRFNLLYRAFSEGDFTGCETFLLPSHLIIL